MGTDKVRVNVPSGLKDTIENHVEENGYMDISEFVRHAIRQEIGEEKIREETTE